MDTAYTLHTNLLCHIYSEPIKQTLGSIGIVDDTLEKVTRTLAAVIGSLDMSSMVYSGRSGRSGTGKGVRFLSDDKEIQIYQ